MNYFDTSYLTIVWDEQAQCVLLTWKSFVEGDNFRQGMNKAIELMQEKQSGCLLADVQELRVLSQADQIWSATDWQARATKAGLKRVAFITPQRVLAQISVQKTLEQLNRPTNTRYFSEIDEAKDWLRSN